MIIKINNLSFRYPNQPEDTLKSIDLSVEKGEVVALLGSSGVGKSTLLKCISRLIMPQAGEIQIEGKNILAMNGREVRRVRMKTGYIFQNFNLIERNSVLQNVLDGRLAYTPFYRSALYWHKVKSLEVAQNCIERVGLLPYINNRVRNLSGGQKQRVAIARALAQQPKIMLADEPVSSLDPKLTQEIMSLMKKVCLEDNITFIISLHFLDIAKKYASRLIGINNGRIIFNNKPNELTEKDIINIYGTTQDWLLYGRVGY